MTMSNEHGNDNDEALTLVGLRHLSLPKKDFFQSKIRKILFLTFLVTAALVDSKKSVYVRECHVSILSGFAILSSSGTQILKCVRGAWPVSALSTQLQD